MSFDLGELVVINVDAHKRATQAPWMYAFNVKHGATKNLKLLEDTLAIVSRLPIDTNREWYQCIIDCQEYFVSKHDLRSA